MRPLIFFVFLFSLCSIHSAPAQDYSSKKVRIGIAAGANFSNVSHAQTKLPSGLDFEKNNKPSYSFGLRLIAPITERISITTGVNYHIFTFEILQNSFGTDSLGGTIKTKPFVQSWEIPITVTYRFESDKKILKNTFVSGGIGLSLDQFTGYISHARMRSINTPNADTTLYSYSLELSDNQPSLKNTLNASILFGFGKEFKLSQRKSLQLNLWYAQALKSQDKFDIDYVLMGKYNYKYEIKPVISNFRLELVYLPWRL